MREIDSYDSIFLALPLDVQAQKKFAAASQPIRALNPPMTFQKAETVHLTLRFFDRITKNLLPRYLDFFAAMAASVSPFSITIQGYDYFGPSSARKVLWLKILAAPELNRLAELSQRYWPENRPFIPHVTVGRVKNARLFSRSEKEIEKILSGFSITSTFDRLRLYGAREEEKQIPLMDFNFHS